MDLPRLGRGGGKRNAKRFCLAVGGRILLLEYFTDSRVFCRNWDGVVRLVPMSTFFDVRIAADFELRARGWLQVVSGTNTSHLPKLKANVDEVDRATEDRFGIKLPITYRHVSITKDEVRGYLLPGAREELQSLRAF